MLDGTSTSTIVGTGGSGISATGAYGGEASRDHCWDLGLISLTAGLFSALGLRSRGTTTTASLQAARTWEDVGASLEAAPDLRLTGAGGFLDKELRCPWRYPALKLAATKIRSDSLDLKITKTYVSGVVVKQGHKTLFGTFATRSGPTTLSIGDVAYESTNGEHTARVQGSAQILLNLLKVELDFALIETRT